MKYSIGDRVIVKANGYNGIVVESDCGNTSLPYMVWLFDIEKPYWCSDKELLSDLTAIEKPFGLLSKEVQDELCQTDITHRQFLNDKGEWVAVDWATRYGSIAYRLNPNWKGEEVKEMTVGEIEAKLGHRVKVVKGE